jgi:hypothetical protein
MGDLFSQHWQHLLGRISGPLSFRLILQPLVAAFIGWRAGLRDARNGSPAFFWHLLATKLGNRRQLIRDGWKDIGKLFCVAVLIDVAYQIYVLHWVYPGQTLIVATVLALPSYILVRGLTNRIARPRVRPVTTSRL